MHFGTFEEYDLRKATVQSIKYNEQIIILNIYLLSNNCADCFLCEPVVLMTLSGVMMKQQVNWIATYLKPMV